MTPASRSSDFVNHRYYYRLIELNLSPVAIINRCAIKWIQVSNLNFSELDTHVIRTSIAYFTVNHKNYNFLDCDWFKKVLFFTNSLAKLLTDSLLSDSSIPGGGGGVLPEKLGGGVRPATQNPYPIYDQNLRYSLPYL